MGIPAVVVPEYLRTWCEIRDRTPSLAEQIDITRGQIEAEDRAATENPGAVLICDPSALMTEFYSHLYFNTAITIDSAIARRYESLIWCDIDIDWVPDALRDGECFRAHMHQVISDNQALLESLSGTLLHRVSGSVDERVQGALAAGIGRRGNPISS